MDTPKRTIIATGAVLWESHGRGPRTAGFYMEPIRYIFSTLISFQNALTVAFFVDPNYINTLKACLKRIVVEETILLIGSEPEKRNTRLSCLSKDDQVLPGTTGNIPGRS